MILGEAEGTPEGERNRVVSIDFDSEGNPLRTEWQCGCVIRVEGYNSLCCEHHDHDERVHPSPHGRGDFHRSGQTFSSGV